MDNQSVSRLSLDLEFDMARDEHGRRLPEVVVAQIMGYVRQNRPDMFAFRAFTDRVVAVHRTGPMTISAAVRARFPQLRRAPTAHALVSAIR
jgi:hypothetical protein